MALGAVASTAQPGEPKQYTSFEDLPNLGALFPPLPRSEKGLSDRGHELSIGALVSCTPDLHYLRRREREIVFHRQSHALGDPHTMCPAVKVPPIQFQEIATEAQNFLQGATGTTIAHEKG